MHLKTSLDALTMESAVLGGAILGCGGGGKLEDGLLLGEQATSKGGACLIDVAGLSDVSAAAAVMPVYPSGKQSQQIDPSQAQRALNKLQNEQDRAVSGLINGGLGAVESMIGWVLSGFLDIPLLDAGIPATYHPATLQNILAFLQETARSENFCITLAGRHKQHDQRWRGQPTALRHLLAGLPADESETYVATVGPLPPSTLAARTNRVPLRSVLQVGQTVMAVNDKGGEAVVAALRTILPIQFVTFATVIEIDWQGQDGCGRIYLRDEKNRHLQLDFGQRYKHLTVDDQQLAVYPDLIITLGILGTPLTGEEVFMEQDLYLLVAPRTAA